MHHSGRFVSKQTGRFPTLTGHMTPKLLSGRVGKQADLRKSPQAPLC